MLLAIDIGNTHVVLGVFEGERLAHHWRIGTHRQDTSDECAATLRSLAEAQAQRRDSVAAQFQAGAADQLEVLSTQSESVAAELVQLDGELKFHQAAAAMEDAVQRPFQFPAAAFESTRTDLR